MHDGITNGPMLNAYPDSMGGTLGGIVRFLRLPELQDAFSSFYILPSLFNTDLDRGFSVIDYSLNEMLASRRDLDSLRSSGISLTLDFILNHASVLSKQFQDILRNGDTSPCRDFFIDWNKFWAGHGIMTDQGFIEPDPALVKEMFFRKPGLPLLMVLLPDGRSVPYWNTFYQEVRYPRIDAQDLMGAIKIQYPSALALSNAVNKALDSGMKPADIPFGRFEKYRQEVSCLLESGRKYLGQMDLNIQSPLVWAYYDETLKTLAEYGAKIVRLDAFAYASKEPGARNFLNEPGTWTLLKKVRALADRYELTLLPEIHSSYSDHICDRLSAGGYLCYDFFLPGLILDALEQGSGETLVRWACELQDKKIHTVNMLGCHDGIPLLDLKGLLPEDRIADLIGLVVSRGGLVKNLHGQKDIYYQVNATFFSALGEDERKLLLARALQLFMPGKPQVWYLDLFAGTNDCKAVELAGSAGHKEINRTNLSRVQMSAGLGRSVVQDQLSLLRFRNTFRAFGPDAELQADVKASAFLRFIWRYNGYTASLEADLKTSAFAVTGKDGLGNIVYEFMQA